MIPFRFSPGNYSHPDPEFHQVSKLTPLFPPRRLSELFEEESLVFMRKDPDPFDERHPSRTDPECELGRMLKLLFRKDLFLTKVGI